MCVISGTLITIRLHKEIQLLAMKVNGTIDRKVCADENKL